jgi:hypothetical protein
MQKVRSLRRVLAAAMAALAVATAVATVAPSAHASTPKVLKYQDSDGVGQIILDEFLPDPATGGGRLRVQLTQNGRVFEGHGTKVRIHEDPPNQSDQVAIDLVVFTLRDSFGRVFLFRGKIQTGGIAGKLLGSGRYERAGVGIDIDQWFISEQ